MIKKGGGLMMLLAGLFVLSTTYVVMLRGGYCGERERGVTAMKSYDVSFKVEPLFGHLL